MDKLISDIKKARRVITAPIQLTLEIIGTIVLFGAIVVRMFLLLIN